jgi:hypothetical protein
LLNWPGLELSSPELAQSLEARVEEPSSLARVGGVTEWTELSVAVTAQSHPEGEAAPAQAVKGHRLAGQLLDSPPCQGCYQRADPETLGPARDRGKRDPWVRDGLDGRSVGDVIPEEKTFPPALLGTVGELGDGPRIHELVEGRDEDPAFGAHGSTLCHRVIAERPH